MNEMKKIIRKLAQISFKTSKRQINFFLIIFYIFIFLFLSINIFFSQKISPIFFGLVNNDKKSVVAFLQKIINNNNFENQLKYFEKIFGPSLKNDVFAKKLQREIKIKELEQILEKNPQSRDVLYGLYLLNLEKESQKTAEKYLRLAKEIDPEIK